MSLGPQMRRRVIGLMLAILAVLALDQASKYWLLYEVGLLNGPSIVLSDYFTLVMVWNKGVSFGMLSHGGEQYAPYLLVLMAVVISLLMAHFALKSRLRLERLAYGMVIGGALGNALDRLRMGAVADFFYAHIDTLGWPAFNVADAAICTGVAILLLHQLRTSKVTP